MLAPSTISDRPKSTLSTRRILVRTGLVAAALLGVFSLASARAEPLLSQGIGVSNCARVAADIKPAEGLDNPVNLMLYAWVQGYVSAANVALLEYDAKHLDMSELTDTRVLGMLQDYCKAHPDKKPANALDAYIKTTKKLKTQWTTGTVQWDE
jgi:hypothetical protein